MPARRRKSNNDSATRTALLDAAEALMLEEGYAAVTSRRIAGRAGVPNAIHYYFETMDELFIELFRRGASRSLARQEEVLASPQPLWAFWDLLLDRGNGGDGSYSTPRRSWIGRAAIAVGRGGELQLWEYAMPGSGWPGRPSGRRRPIWKP